MEIEAVTHIETNESYMPIDKVSLQCGQRVLLVNTDPRPKWQQWLGTLLWTIGCKRFFSPTQDGVYVVTRTAGKWHEWKRIQ